MSISEDLAIPVMVQLGDNVWKFSRLTEGIKAYMEAWIIARVQGQAIKDKAKFGEDYLSVLERINERIASGYYGYGSLGFYQVLQAETGTVELICQLLQPNHPELKPEELRKWVKEITALYGAELKLTLTSIFDEYGLAKKKLNQTLDLNGAVSNQQEKVA